ncbi:hypothetical protein ACH41C_18560 [Streptomyces althioticus]|uniref:hypothetical protein n=1 Tax=Streptomyces althioticus TaxID=83380 RepID=UPI0033E89590
MTNSNSNTNTSNSSKAWAVPLAFTIAIIIGQTAVIIAMALGESVTATLGWGGGVFAASFGLLLQAASSLGFTK